MRPPLRECVKASPKEGFPAGSTPSRIRQGAGYLHQIPQGGVGEKANVKCSSMRVGVVIPGDMHGGIVRFLTSSVECLVIRSGPRRYNQNQDHPYIVR